MCQLVVEINFGSAVDVRQPLSRGVPPLKDGEKGRKRSAVQADVEVTLLFPRNTSSNSSRARFTNSI